MKAFKIKIRIHFPKKNLFHDKTEKFKLYVYVPDEWNKKRIEYFAFEAAREYIKKFYPFTFKKGTFKLNMIDFEEKHYIKKDVKVYTYNHKEKCGKWVTNRYAINL